MIIDSILDRKDGRHYSAYNFYLEVRNVQRVLCQYIQRNGYPADIEGYIRSQIWVV